MTTAQRFKLTFRAGEALRGYAVTEGDPQLLVDLGIAKFVTDWGFYVTDKVAGHLGKEFSLSMAKHYAEVMGTNKPKGEPIPAMTNPPCPRCGTWCYGDCTAN